MLKELLYYGPAAIGGLVLVTSCGERFSRIGVYA